MQWISFELKKRVHFYKLYIPTTTKIIILNMWSLDYNLPAREISEDAVFTMFDSARSKL